MQLADLLGKDLSLMSEDELQTHLNSLHRLKMRSSRSKPTTSNKSKRAKNLLDQLSSDEVNLLIAKIKEKKGVI